MLFTISCLNCGQSFSTPRNPATRTVKYCSRGCRDVYEQKQYEAMTEKQCRDCGAVKKREQFYVARTKTNTSRLRSICKDCGNKRSRAWKAQYKAINSIGYEAQRATDSRLYYFKRLLQRKDRNGRLTADYLSELYDAQEGRCALTGVTMTLQAGKGRLQTNVSLDQIDPGKGYQPENVQLVCRYANTMKSNMTATEFYWWIEQAYLWAKHQENKPAARAA